MAREFAAIVNPVSGRSAVLPRVFAVGRAVERGGGTLDISVTEAEGHATQLASRLDHNVAGVLVVGGDGTVNEVINGLAGRPVPMLVLRTGTENLLARELNMPTEPTLVAATLLHGEVVQADVGVVNGRRFLTVVGIGFDAECVVRMHHMRRGHITHADYFWPIWRTFWAHRFPTLRVEVDGACVFERPGFALVGVRARYSIGLRILAHARPDDGLLDVAAFPCSSRAAFTFHAARAVLRRHLSHGGVIYRQCRTVRIESSDAVPIEVDGETGGLLPVDCTVVPGAARLLRPREGDGAEFCPGIS